VFELRKTDHGIDGWDAKTTIEAYFTSQEAAIKYLSRRDFTYDQYGSYYHADKAYRHCMGCISYRIVKTDDLFHVDPV